MICIKAFEVMDQLFTYGQGYDYTHTCDTLKAGCADKTVSRVAVTMTATIPVLEQVIAWGADMLIVHEPTFFTCNDTYSDEPTDDPVDQYKRKLVRDSGLVIYRFHDHSHYADPDMIAAGMLEQMELDADITYPEPYNLVRATLNTPTTAVELATLLEQRLNIRHIKICGARDIPSTKLSARFGASGGIIEELQRPETQILLCGEVVEWLVAEYARDLAATGQNKSLLILGHVGSERYGMDYIAKRLQEHLPQIKVQYFDCGEVYTYSDS